MTFLMHYFDPKPSKSQPLQHDKLHLMGPRTKEEGIILYWDNDFTILFHFSYNPDASIATISQDHGR